MEKADIESFKTKNSGVGLLSHIKDVCSIISDEELNFRVRNGIGCTLFSMAAKKIGIVREEGSFFH